MAASQEGLGSMKLVDKLAVKMSVSIVKSTLQIAYQKGESSLTGKGTEVNSGNVILIN
jgi:hypothetical protein